MPNLIINKVPSASGTPGNLVIDKYVPTTFTPSTVGEIYWRWEDEPTATPTLLTAQRQERLSPKRLTWAAGRSGCFWSAGQGTATEASQMSGSRSRSFSRRTRRSVF
jgi:hypothetical protein